MASNYDVMMRQMTEELLAEKIVHLVNITNKGLFFLTSSGQLFETSDYGLALQHEYNWLMYDPEKEKDRQADCSGCETECADGPSK